MSEEQTHKGSEQSTLKNCVHGACFGGAGLLIGHLGCVITPVTLAALGVAGIAVSSPFLAVGIGAGITAGGLGAWYGLRGRFAMAAEKKVVVASALTGFALMSAFNLACHRHHGIPDRASAAAWFETLPSSEQEKIRDIAVEAGVAPDDYIAALHGIPALSESEKESLRKVVGEACPCTVPGACKVPGLSP